MSHNKRPNTANEYYANHLHGKFKNNPEAARGAIIERMYRRLLTELATNRFKWEGLPDEVDVRFLEMNLFYHALSVFYFDKDVDKFMAIQGSGTSWLNYMDNPTAFTVVGNNFRGKTVSAKDAIPIWANYLRIPDLDIVTIYAHKLAEIDRTIEINSDNARMSKFIISGENQRLTARNINRALSEGSNSIEVAGPMQDLQMIQALDLGVNPESFEKLHILRTRLWNECMGLLGIENANQDKKERLVAAEVDANNDQTSMMRYVNLNARRIAVKQINAKFPDLDVSVSYYSESAPNVPNVLSTENNLEIEAE